MAKIFFGPLRGCYAPVLRTGATRLHVVSQSTHRQAHIPLLKPRPGPSVLKFIITLCELLGAPCVALVELVRFQSAFVVAMKPSNTMLCERYASIVDRNSDKRVEFGNRSLR